MFDWGLVEFEALASALDGLVDVDPLGMSDGQVHRQLIELQRQESRLEAVTLRLASSWDTRRTWAENGSKSAEARLAREAKVRRATAARQLRRARALAAMPATAAALAAGAITVDHVDLLMQANATTRLRCRRFPVDEEMLVGFCRESSFFEADRSVRYWINRVDAELDDDGPEPAYRDRECTTGRGIGNEVHLRAILDPVGGGEFLEALDRIERDLYRDDKQSGNERSDTQRRADALVEMARRAMATPADGRKPRPLITVVTGDESFRWLCELSDGAIVTPRSLLPYISTADVEAALFDGPLHGVGVSSQRTFTGALRRIIEIRDRHCQHPCGCDVPMSKCDVDHIVPHSEGGITRQAGGRLQCESHNRNSALHRLGPANVTVYDDDPATIALKARLEALRRKRPAWQTAGATDHN